MLVNYVYGIYSYNECCLPTNARDWNHAHTETQEDKSYIVVVIYVV